MSEWDDFQQQKQKRKNKRQKDLSRRSEEERQKFSKCSNCAHFFSHICDEHQPGAHSSRAGCSWYDAR